MAYATATLSQYRQAPRKVRVLSDLVRGKKVADALITLEFTAKRASAPILKLIQSAVANAKSQDMNVENLFIQSIEVNGGAILYRRRPVSRGSAHPIRKRTSHVTVRLSDTPLVGVTKKTRIAKEVEVREVPKKRVNKTKEKTK